MNKKLYDFEDQIYVRESGIHGLGMFVSVDIPKDAIIMPITGEMITGDECERREDEENNVYIFWHSDDYYLDTNKSEKIKFINHNCNYNCDVDEDENGNLILIAVKDIKAGEELTIDYGYEDIYDNCNCNYCEPDRQINQK